MKKTLAFLGAGIFFGGLLAWILLNPVGNEGFFTAGASIPTADPAPSGSAQTSTIPRVGETAPDFELTTYDNRKIRLSELRGSPILVNFWATWCGPCRIEMPAIQSQFARFAPDLKVLAVNYDETPEQIESFARELDLEFDLLVDPGGKVSEEDYFVRAYPSSYFIDREGVIQVVHLGLMSDAQLDDYLKRIGVE